ncbi:hypothetical protein GT347_21735 [Xylophilus rhododendri]|uniref:Lipoprotein n=1 Tax=Xylophilus rhododendri TaxID=2697032 RepID=A0A857J9F9_9BURK|nr:hypothetical protein [Xylophilus rhododendri]QHJ00368.1 hypothetical protein GT347_21735 [Xylophilus rhododendri]
MTVHSRTPSPRRMPVGATALLSLVLCGALQACGGGNTPVVQTPTPAPTTDEPKPVADQPVIRCAP